MSTTPQEYIDTELKESEQGELSCPEGVFVENGRAFDTNEAHLLYYEEQDGSRRYKFKNEEGYEFDVIEPRDGQKVARNVPVLAFAAATLFVSTLPLFIPPLFPVLDVLTFLAGGAASGVTLWAESVAQSNDHDEPRLRKSWEPGTDFKDEFIESFEAILGRSDLQYRDGEPVGVKPGRYRAEHEGSSYVFGPAFVYYYNERCFDEDEHDATDEDSEPFLPAQSNGS